MGKRRKKSRSREDYDEDEPENNNTKNILIGIAVLLVLGGIGFLIYYLVKKKKPSPTPTPTSSPLFFRENTLVQIKTPSNKFLTACSGCSCGPGIMEKASNEHGFTFRVKNKSGSLNTVAFQISDGAISQSFRDSYLNTGTSSSFTSDTCGEPAKTVLIPFNLTTPNVVPETAYFTLERQSDGKYKIKTSNNTYWTLVNNCKRVDGSPVNNCTSDQEMIRFSSTGTLFTITTTT
jgi:hypothetical protein